MLDRKSNRDVDSSSLLVEGLIYNDNEELVLPPDYIWTMVSHEQGYRPRSVLNEWSLLRIPAGELGLTFTVSTESVENDITTTIGIGLFLLCR